MSRICFASWEIHPTTRGGCGVLLHHAATQLLNEGHEVTFLFDMDEDSFCHFNTNDRLALPNPQNCHAYHVETLCSDLPWSLEQVPNIYQWRSLRFAHALEKVQNERQFDFVEFFEYCGSAYYTLVNKLYHGSKSVLGVRLHNTIEIMDKFRAYQSLDRELYEMYGLERGCIDLAQVILSPSQTYFDSEYRNKYALSGQNIVVSQPPGANSAPVWSGNNSDTLKVVYVGKVNPLKNVEQLVQAAVLFLSHDPSPNAQFVLIGECSSDLHPNGEYQSYLRRIIPSRFQQNFRFTGHLSHEQILEELRTASFAVFPNLSESFCYALHETYNAGVPVIVNNLSGFQDFFIHDKNCLTYDHSTEDLLLQLQRLASDSLLRKRLSRPFAVVTKPLGEFYSYPSAPSAIRCLETNSPDMETLILILQDGEHDVDPTLAGLNDQTHKKFRTVMVRDAKDEDPLCVSFLGRLRVFTDIDGYTVDPFKLRTSDAVLLLEAGDVVSNNWLKLCTGALFARRMAFAGTWASCNGKLIPATLDFCPESFPACNGSTLTRCLIRTTPGKPLVELFDPYLENVGEIGYVWKAISQWGRGCILPEALLSVNSERSSPVEGRHLAYLFSNYGQVFANRLALLGAMLQTRYLDQLQMLLPDAHKKEVPLNAKLFEPVFEKKIKERVAESLGGLHLLRLIVRRWLTRKKRS